MPLILLIIEKKTTPHGSLYSATEIYFDSHSRAHLCV